MVGKKWKTEVRLGFKRRKPGGPGKYSDAVFSGGNTAGGRVARRAR